MGPGQHYDALIILCTKRLELDQLHAVLQPLKHDLAVIGYRIFRQAKIQLS